MKPPDPFDIDVLQRPKVSKGEASEVAALLETSGWKTVQRLWDWQASVMNLSLINAEESYAFHQGAIKGFSQARRIIEWVVALASAEETDFNDLSLEEASYAKWAAKSTNGRGDTGYGE